jgi:hypothetical protein
MSPQAAFLLGLYFGLQAAALGIAVYLWAARDRAPAPPSPPERGGLAVAA